MVAQGADALASTEPVLLAFAEHPVAPGKTRRIGRLRLPISGPYRPWATLYRLPDARLYWVVRLWEVDRPVRRCLPTSTLVAFCDGNGLSELRQSLDALLWRAERSRGRV